MYVCRFLHMLHLPLHSGKIHINCGIVTTLMNHLVRLGARHNGSVSSGNNWGGKWAEWGGNTAL